MHSRMQTRDIFFLNTLFPIMHTSLAYMLLLHIRFYDRQSNHTIDITLQLPNKLAKWLVALLARA
jgi:hypothetical protein